VNVPRFDFLMWIPLGLAMGLLGAG